MAEDYTVSTGECMHSIAFEHGFFWETLWNHANNAALKDLRQDPSVLFEGDVVHIPDLTVREESCGAEQTHRFRLKGVPAHLRIRLMQDDQPIANQPFELDVDGRTETGTTDGDGNIDVPVMPNASGGELIVGEGADRAVYPLDFGYVDPLDTESGVAGRLADLGYSTDPDLAEALRSFQARNGLSETGEIDQATRDKLEELFGH
jgi:hypothetical protein